jgi:ribonuclease J
MRLTIHRGANQIGGSCVEIATDQTRIILDVGVPLDAMESESPTPLDVPGLFQDGKRVDAILLSHSHLDHCGLLPLADPKIPVYLSKGADQGLAILRLFARQDLAKGHHLRPTLKSGFTQCFGDIRVTPFEVNHSAPGCLAFLIEAAGGTVFYSGDLRLHGRQSHLFKELRAGIKRKKIDVLLMEGTTLATGRRKGVTESELETKLYEKISNASGLVFALLSPLHLDRLKSFLNAAQRSGRTFVPDLYAAYVMHMFQKEGFPSPARRRGIPVFFNEGSRNKIERSKLNSEFKRNEIARADLLSNPERYVLPARLSTFELDFPEIPPGSTFIYSFWRGYLEQAEWKKLTDRIRAAGSGFVPCHTSGHIFPDDIKRFIETLQPRLLVPIHTEAPGAFKKLHPRTKLLEDGEILGINCPARLRP